MITQKWAAVGLVLGALLATPPAASETYPSKPVTLVVPFSPGASNDIFGRYVAKSLSEHWKQTVIVENKPGAGSVLGTAHVARAKPDGSTLLFVSSTFTTTAASWADLPYDPTRDLEPIRMVAIGQMVVVAGNRVPAKSLQELVAAAKRQELFYGTAGVGSSPHFSAELLANVAGIKMQAVHYKGGTEALLDLVNGRTDAYVGTLTTILPMLTDGRAKAIAIASTTRSAMLPEVPTIAEAGFAGAESDFWWAVFAPAGLPHDIAGRINASLAATMQLAEATSFLEKQGAALATMSIERFKAHVATELARWRAIARKHNITVN